MTFVSMSVAVVYDGRKGVPTHNELIQMARTKIKLAGIAGWHF